ncbi:MAG: ZIP family metal transporter [Flavobacteriaceae bacterium]|nr:ZIP family metal transporter [Flavobacteriaceae bacterium]
MLDITLSFLAIFMGVGIHYTGFSKSKKATQSLLLFSGAFLLGTIVLEVLPFVFQSQSNVGVFVLAGILLQLFLETLSKGVEHGHFHLKNSKPIIVMFALSVHSFLEGIPMGKFDHYLLAIVLHKIPVGIVFYQFLKAINLHLVLTWLLITGFAFMTPLGSLSADYFSLFQNFEIELYAFSAGLLIHIASIILFESDDNHQLNLSKLIVVLLGTGLAYLL